MNQVGVAGLRHIDI